MLFDPKVLNPNIFAAGAISTLVAVSRGESICRSLEKHIVVRPVSLSHTHILSLSLSCTLSLSLTLADAGRPADAACVPVDVVALVGEGWIATLQWQSINAVLVTWETQYA